AAGLGLILTASGFAQEAGRTPPAGVPVAQQPATQSAPAGRGRLRMPPPGAEWPSTQARLLPRSHLQPDSRPAPGQGTATQPATAPATSPAATQSAAVAVYVNGSPILDKDLDEKVADQVGTLNLPDHLKARFFESLRPSILQTMIDLKLLDEQIAKAGFKLEEQDFRRLVEEEAEGFRSMQGWTKEEFERQLRIDANKSLPEFLDSRSKDPVMRLNWLREEFTIHKFPDTLKFTPAEIDEYYREKKDLKFSRPARARASEILIGGPFKTDEEKANARKLAETVLAEARKPDADFAALAARHSTAPTKARGGDIGLFSREDKAIPAAIIVAAFNLQVGQVSDILEGSDGFRILKLTERHLPTAITREQADAGIRWFLRNRNISQQRAKYQAELRAAAKIEYPPGKQPAADGGPMVVPIPPGATPPGQPNTGSGQPVKIEPVPPPQPPGR
ncbi:MAG: peptidylprolyl isomerase, partial [Planctomycetota bacterium]